jgi:hypothetical protein
MVAATSDMPVLGIKTKNKQLINTIHIVFEWIFKDKSSACLQVFKLVTNGCQQKCVHDVWRRQELLHGLTESPCNHGDETNGQ